MGRLFVGDLEGVLSTHWLAAVNEKTHLFWAFNRFVNRLECVCEEYGIEVVERSEKDTSRECPECGEREETTRNGDYFACSCGFEGHADLKASRVFLERETERSSVGPMARPVRLEWNNQEWRRIRTAPTFRRTNAKEERTNRSTRLVGNVASVGSGGV